jgi:hypothetical protein
MNKPSYDWSTSLWGACSATACGTSGTQSRSVVCKKNGSVVTNDSFCTTPKPSVIQSCSAPACPSYTYSWTVGAWSACSATACGTQGVQTRSVICTRNDGIAVADTNCTTSKPVTSQACAAAACPVPSYLYTWSVGAWSACSATACGTQGTQTRSVICKRDDGVTVADSYCTTTKPSTSQACAAAACPVPSYLYTWTVGAWSACSATACGTQGTQTRSVICKRDDGVTVADSYCTTTKPSTSQPCSAQPCSGAFVPPVRARGPASVDVKSFGAAGDGTKDDTIAIQAAINSLPTTGGTVTIPAGTYLVDAVKSIKLKNYMLLSMDPNAVLKEKANSVDNSRVFNLDLVHDVEIAGGKIIGDRDIHTGTTGESGHGISMHGAVRVTIRNIVVSKCWGDGFYIGAYQQAPVVYGDDIVLYQVVATQNRRQGLSITNATNVKIYESEFSYTQGTPPQFGIDIEPNQINTRDNQTRYARDIEIVGCKIHHNKGGAIQFYRYVYSVLVKGNELSYNSHGIFSVQSYDTTVVGNLIAHNEQKGISFQTESNNMSVDQNTFRNNWTAQFGQTNDTNALTAVTGTSTVTNPHIGIMTGSGLINVLTNEYAK